MNLPVELFKLRQLSKVFKLKIVNKLLIQDELAHLRKGN